MGKFYTDPTTGQRVEIQKTHKFRNFVVLPAVGFLAVGMIFAAANGGSHPAPTTPVAPAAETNTGGASTVEATGDGQASLGVMANGLSQSTVTLPHTQQLPEGMVTVTVTRMPSMQSYMDDGRGDAGTVTCTITRDGKVVDTKTASGEFASVSCTKMY